MASPEPKRPPLMKTFLRIKNNTPDVFEQLVNDFASYTDQAAQELASADPNNILRVQGHVQNCLAIMRMLHECHLEPKPKPTP